MRFTRQQHAFWALLLQKRRKERQAVAAPPPGGGGGDALFEDTFTGPAGGLLAHATDSGDSWAARDPGIWSGGPAGIQLNGAGDVIFKPADTDYVSGMYSRGNIKTGVVFPDTYALELDFTLDSAFMANGGDMWLYLNMPDSVASGVELDLTTYDEGEGSYILDLYAKSFVAPNSDLFVGSHPAVLDVEHTLRVEVSPASVVVKLDGATLMTFAPDAGAILADQPTSLYFQQWTEDARSPFRLHAIRVEE